MRENQKIVRRQEKVRFIENFKKNTDSIQNLTLMNNPW
jgi:hypothetical protein